MATATITPAGTITIPNGGSVDVQVTWTLDPGTQDENGHLLLTLDGETLLDVPVTKSGRPAEQAPSIKLQGEATSPGDAVLTCDVASVARLSATTFRLS